MLWNDEKNHVLCWIEVIIGELNSDKFQLQTYNFHVIIETNQVMLLMTTAAIVTRLVLDIRQEFKQRTLSMRHSKIKFLR